MESLVIATILWNLLLPKIPQAEAVEKVQAIVTAYTSSVAETDQDPFITASGSIAGKGAAACPSKYPFGIRISIAGETFTCLDRMHSRFRDGEFYDIWMPSRSEAIAFGRQKLDVVIHR